MANYVVATIKSWNVENFHVLKKKYPEHNWTIFSKKEDFTKEVLEKLKPDYVFIPHWSWIIKKNIYDSYECIVFHMTDLPYGRGGSPLQNLIVLGKKETKISAIRVAEGIDTGDIYIKEPLTLDGSATEIFKRFSEIVFTKMIPQFLENSIKPKPQSGEITTFVRRKPDQSNLVSLESIEKVYDYIRMLDAEGYPHAFIDSDFQHYTFTNATYNSDRSVTATVNIKPKEQYE